MDSEQDEQLQVAVRSHGIYDSESESDSSGGKSDFDEEYETYKPPPIPLEDGQYDIVKIGPFQTVLYKKHRTRKLHYQKPKSSRKVKKQNKRNCRTKDHEDNNKNRSTRIKCVNTDKIKKSNKCLPSFSSNAPECALTTNGNAVASLPQPVSKLKYKHKKVLSFASAVKPSVPSEVSKSVGDHISIKSEQLKKDMSNSNQHETISKPSLRSLNLNKKPVNCNVKYKSDSRERLYATNHEDLFDPNVAVSKNGSIPDSQLHLCNVSKSNGNAAAKDKKHKFNKEDSDISMHLDYFNNLLNETGNQSQVSAKTKSTLPHVGTGTTPKDICIKMQLLNTAIVKNNDELESIPHCSKTNCDSHANKIQEQQNQLISSNYLDKPERSTNDVYGTINLNRQLSATDSQNMHDFKINKPKHSRRPKKEVAYSSNDGERPNELPETSGHIYSDQISDMLPWNMISNSKKVNQLTSSVTNSQNLDTTNVRFDNGWDMIPYKPAEVSALTIRSSQLSSSILVQDLPKSKKNKRRSKKKAITEEASHSGCSNESKHNWNRQQFSDETSACINYRNQNFGTSFAIDPTMKPPSVSEKWKEKSDGEKLYDIDSNSNHHRVRNEPVDTSVYIDRIFEAWLMNIFQDTEKLSLPLSLATSSQNLLNLKANKPKPKYDAKEKEFDDCHRNECFNYKWNVGRISDAAAANPTKSQNRNCLVYDASSSGFYEKMTSNSQKKNHKRKRSKRRTKFNTNDTQLQLQEVTTNTSTINCNDTDYFHQPTYPEKSKISHETDPDISIMQAQNNSALAVTGGIDPYGCSFSTKCSSLLFNVDVKPKLNKKYCQSVSTVAVQPFLFYFAIMILRKLNNKSK